MSRRRLLLPALLVLAALIAPRAPAATVTLRPSKDTTIYGDANLSNGGGQFLFAGTNGERRRLRSLIAFDLSGQVPAGATLNSVSLTFTVNTPLANNRNTVNLHRLLADWGEGSVVAPMGEGGGAAAGAGDATWNSRNHNTTAWTTPGGDFTATASATQSVGAPGTTVTFTSDALAADVRAWLVNPATNFGWIMIAADEAGAPVRFASRQGSPAPSLVIDFTVGSGGGGNTAPTITTQPASQTVAAGSSVTFNVVAAGSPAPTYQWRKDNTPLANATSASFTIASVTPADAGTYTVVVSNAAGNITSQPATLTVTSAPPPPPPGGAVTARLSNLSVRAAMAADQTLFVGFAVSGGNRQLLLRGVGPTLASLGLAGAMTDPRLELYNGTTLEAQNNDWNNSPTLAAAFTSVGAFSFVPDSRDAALLQAVDGSRSVQLKGTGAGVALVELYDTGTGNTPRLVNVSARNQVGTGDNILIFGFFIDGTGSKNLLIRAVGPQLAALGVTGTLADPRLDVFRSGTAAAIASNDNWDAALASTFTSVGAFALTANSRDAALVTTLTAGAYTVQVSGVANTTGEALVEIYELP